MAGKKTVLIVGGGGREHAIAWKLAQSPRIGALYAAPGNGGIARLAACVPVPVDDVAGQVGLAREIGADLVVVGPELPLSLGLVDALQRAGIPAVGPTQAAARIESSKKFAKEVMEAAGIPTAAYDVVQHFAEAAAVIEEHFGSAGGAGVSPPSPLVLKADGLAAGKGVFICADEEQALAVARDMLSGDALGGAGTTVVIEQFLTGPEVSLLAFCDGRRAVPMPLAQDYKRLLTEDEGPNTGGMGSISPVPGTDDALHSRLVATCLDPLLAEMARRGTPFRGILFAGLMLTPSGPMVLEYNARFGDPETQSLLRRLEGDLLELLEATAAGDLSGAAPVWSEDAACCVVMAAEGYPDEPVGGVVIGGLERYEPGDGNGVEADQADGGGAVSSSDAATDGVIAFHGGTARDNEGRLVSAGGRVLSVTATGSGLEDALRKAYAAVDAIDFPGSIYRTDIGGFRHREPTTD